MKLRVVNDQFGCAHRRPEHRCRPMAHPIEGHSHSTPRYRPLYHFASEPVSTWHDFAAAIFAELAESGRERALGAPSSRPDYHRRVSPLRAEPARATPGSSGARLHAPLRGRAVELARGTEKGAGRPYEVNPNLLMEDVLTPQPSAAMRSPNSLNRSKPPGPAKKKAGTMMRPTPSSAICSMPRRGSASSGHRIWH